MYIDAVVSNKKLSNLFDNFIISEILYNMLKIRKYFVIVQLFFFHFRQFYTLWGHFQFKPILFLF